MPHLVEINFVLKYAAEDDFWGWYHLHMSKDDLKIEAGNISDQCIVLHSAKYTRRLPIAVGKIMHCNISKIHLLDIWLWNLQLHVTEAFYALCWLVDGDGDHVWDRSTLKLPQINSEMNCIAIDKCTQMNSEPDIQNLENLKPEPEIKEATWDAEMRTWMPRH